MLYQSLKLTNGIWVLAELRIQPSNPSFTVRPFPCLPPKQPRGGSAPRRLPALLPTLPSPLSARSSGQAGWSRSASAVAGRPQLLSVPAPSPLCQSWRPSRMGRARHGLCWLAGLCGKTWALLGRPPGTGAAPWWQQKEGERSQPTDTAPLK